MDCFFKLKPIIAVNRYLCSVFIVIIHFNELLLYTKYWFLKQLTPFFIIKSIKICPIWDVNKNVSIFNLTTKKNYKPQIIIILRQQLLYQFVSILKISKFYFLTKILYLFNNKKKTNNKWYIKKLSRKFTKPFSEK